MDERKGKETAEKIWSQFLALAAIEVFGEKAVFLEGKKVKNFLGSVERYKKLFDRAAEHVLTEETKEDERGRP